MAETIWDVGLVLLWFAGVASGLKLWVYLLRPVASWYYMPARAPTMATQVAAAVGAAIAVGVARIPVAALVLILSVITVIVLLFMAPLTLIAYRDRIRRM